MIPRRTFLRDLAKSLLWLPVAPAIVSAQNVFSTRRRVINTGNGLLNSLISYWKFDVDVSPYADSVGSNPLTGSGTNAAFAGLINNGLSAGIGSSSASHASNSDFIPSAGTSLSISFWASTSNWVGGTGPFPTFMNKGDNATLNSYNALIVTSSGQMVVTLEDSSTAQAVVALTPGLPTPNVFHHVVLVFDATAKTFSGYYDGVIKGTVSTATDQIVSGAQNFYFGPGAGFGSWADLKIDEACLYHRALTAGDVTNLYSGGAALPLSNFTT